MESKHQSPKDEGRNEADALAARELERALLELVHSGFADLGEDTGAAALRSSESGAPAPPSRSRFRVWGW